MSGRFIPPQLAAELLRGLVDVRRNNHLLARTVIPSSAANTIFLCYSDSMIILLAGINAKYSHTNLAIRLLRGYAEIHSPYTVSGEIQVIASEWNINMLHGNVLRGIVEKKPSVVLFSTYIWNRDFIHNLAKDLHAILPDVIIGFGGPEVSWSVEETFRVCPSADLIISGEGEQILCDLIELLYVSTGIFEAESYAGISGISTKNRLTGNVFKGRNRTTSSCLDCIPFPYSGDKLDFNPENRIVYYESSRGCPFSCAYCLSSIDKSVRYYSLPRVLEEIGYFMREGYPLVKFVDRTFNLDPERYLAIWKYIRDQHNGKTLFHFEIAAEYLTDADFDFLDTIKEGSIQFEIGIQSINPETLKIVGRPAHPEKLAAKIRRIPRTIHVHVDLIAGLPVEDFQSFSRSFDYAFALDAGMLQLGFLKILAGSPMEILARNTPGYKWSSIPPYEVLETPVLSYYDLVKLKDVEHVLDSWYNSALLRNTLKSLVSSFSPLSPFAFFIQLVSFIRAYYPDGDLYLPRRPADSFACLASYIQKKKREGIASGDSEEYLRWDFLLQGKPGTYPAWYERRYSKTAHDTALDAQALIGSDGYSRRTAYSRTEYEVFLFGKGIEKTEYLFIYSEGQNKEKRVKTIKL